jgi:hypothetical protein
MENRRRYHSNDNYQKLKALTLIHRKIVEKVSDLKTELRLSLSVLCPGYGKAFKDILSATSLQILKRTVKHTKLFEMTREEILDILVHNHYQMNRRDEQTEKIMYAFRNTTCPDYMKDPMIIGVKFILGQYELLLQQRRQIEKRLIKIYDEMAPIISTIDGVGPIVGSAVLGIVGDIRRFPNLNAITAFAGLDPVVHQSGKLHYRTGHISKRGNKYLRTVLLNAALVAMRHNPVIHARYYHLRRRGKNHWTAIIACARKLLHIIYSVEKNQKEFYVPDYLDSV